MTIHISKSNHSGVGSNAGRSRAYNRGLVLGYLRRAGPSGRAEIARYANLSIQTVSNIITDLETDGLLRVVGQRSGTRGLPVIQYDINPQGAHAIGLEVRTDAMRMVIVDLSGQRRWTGRLSLQKADPQTVLPLAQRLKSQALNETGITTDNMVGAGIVLPGPFGQTGLSDQATELEGWQNHDAREAFQSALSLTVIIENDASAAAISERLFGVAQGLSDFAYIYFGTGVGLGLVAGDNLVRGAFGNAGELGHLHCDGIRLQDVASRLSLAQRLSGKGIENRTVSDLNAVAETEIVAEWVHDAGEALSSAVNILETLFDPETIVLGGALPNVILDKIVAAITLQSASLSNRSDRTCPRLMRGSGGNMTATMGAAALVIDQFFTASLTPL